MWNLTALEYTTHININFFSNIELKLYIIDNIVEHTSYSTCITIWKMEINIPPTHLS